MASGTGIFSKERHLLMLKSLECASNALFFWGAASCGGANWILSSLISFSSAFDPMSD